MVNNVKRSVTSTIAKAMVLILLLCGTTISFAIFTLASSLSDAEAVNVSGSMRMQSYRLAHDIQSESVDYQAHIAQFERSIYSESMKALQNWSVPDDITQDYYQLIIRWHELKQVLNGADRVHYLSLVEDFVDQIDAFVFKLQNYSEDKLVSLAWVGGLGLGSVFMVSVFVVHYSRKQIVKPLKSLMIASEQIQSRSFDVELNATSNNEMGVLANAFNSMARDLGKLYQDLETAVNEKTQKLQHANDSLRVLYQSSQELTASRITPDNFIAILKHIVSLEGIEAARLEIDQPGEKRVILTEGLDCRCQEESNQCQSERLSLDGVELGTLYWKVSLPCPDQALIDNFVQILSRAIYYNHAQRQSEQLLVMEERATIARELHDSLAQSLSYLKIQVSILKREMKALTSSDRQGTDTLAEIDIGLSAAYTQLRELLTTFRLTINEGSFGSALQTMAEQLSEQTDARIELSNELSSIELDTNQQVHLLQLIREATTNAIKHANAQHIAIDCVENDTHIKVRVRDDGKGFDATTEKANHYGLSIMQERASRLNGELSIVATPDSGCEVYLEYPKTKD